MLIFYLIQENLLFTTKTPNVKTGIKEITERPKKKYHLIYLIPEDWDSG